MLSVARSLLCGHKWRPCKKKEYVIITAFPLQQWLQERASVLVIRTYIASFVLVLRMLPSFFQFPLSLSLSLSVCLCVCALISFSVTLPFPSTSFSRVFFLASHFLTLRCVYFFTSRLFLPFLLCSCVYFSYEIQISFLRQQSFDLHTGGASF
jgi:hypothetical protein